MINISTQEIYVYSTHVNMRNSFDSLCFLVDSMFPEKLLTGSVFVFLNKAGNSMKVLYWDLDGFVIYYKRLEKGRFRIEKNGKTQISRREFFMLLEGIKPKVLNARFSLEKNL